MLRCGCHKDERAIGKFRHILESGEDISPGPGSTSEVSK